MMRATPVTAHWDTRATLTSSTGAQVRLHIHCFPSVFPAHAKINSSQMSSYYHMKQLRIFFFWERHWLISRKTIGGTQVGHLVIKQIERRGQNRHNKRQSVVSPDWHTNCKDLDIIFKSGRTNSHWTFVGTVLDVVEVRRGRRDLILQHHRRRHLADVAREPNLKEKLKD